jgi:hypothetical protein
LRAAARSHSTRLHIALHLRPAYLLVKYMI